MTLLKILFLENTLEGIFIIIVLLALLAVVFHFARLHTARYQKSEIGLLDKVRTRLRQLVESGEDDDPRHVLEQLIACIPRDSRGQLQDSLIGDRLLAIQKIRASHAKVNVQALQEMSMAKENSRRGLSFPSFLVGFAMLLGLLGTIIGLTKMVQTIHLTLPNSADILTPDTLNSIRDVLSSMKSAFSATLIGLVCSITASLLNLRLEKAQSRFFESLERFTVEELLPKTAPSIEDETLLEKVSTQMERYFDELREVAEQNSQTIEDLSAAQRAIGTTIAGIEQMSQNGSAGNVQEVIGHLTGVIGELHSTNQSVVKLTDRLPETLDVARKANQTMQQQVNTLLDSHQKWQTRLEGSLTSITRTMPEVSGQRHARRDEGGRAERPLRPSREGSGQSLAEYRPLDEPLSQRMFLIYGAAGLFLLAVVLTWLR